MTQVPKYYHIKIRKSVILTAVSFIGIFYALFLLITIQQQRQIYKEFAQTTQQNPVTPAPACNDTTVLATAEANNLEQLCQSNPQTEACKQFCQRTGGTSKMCQPGGVYSCLGHNAQQCQSGKSCTTKAHDTGIDNFCTGGQICCEGPQPAGGHCVTKPDCQGNLLCTGNKCTPPPPPPPPPPAVPAGGGSAGTGSSGGGAAPAPGGSSGGGGGWMGGGAGCGVPSAPGGGGGAPAPAAPAAPPLKQV